MDIPARAKRFLARLRELPAEDAPNPQMVRLSEEHIAEASRRVQQAIVDFSDVVAREEEAWGFSDVETT